MSETPRKVGRPCKFNEFLSLKIVELAEKGLTTAQIGEVIGVSEKTLNIWMRNDQEFRTSVKEAKMAADELVEASLFRRAVGYSHPDVKHVVTRDCVETHDIVKHYPPETLAMIYWLKNRQPEKWRDKTETEHSVNPDSEGLFGPWQLKDPQK